MGIPMVQDYHCMILYTYQQNQKPNSKEKIKDNAYKTSYISSKITNVLRIKQEIELVRHLNHFKPLEFVLIHIPTAHQYNPTAHFASSQFNQLID